MLSCAPRNFANYSVAIRMSHAVQEYSGKASLGLFLATQRLGRLLGTFPLHCSLIAQPKLPGQHVRIPDFMWIATHSGAWFPTLIEIEKPSKRIYNKDGTPSSHFSQARNQLNQWRSWFTSNANVEQFKEMYGIPDYMLRRRQMNLHMILVYGRRSELDEQPDLIRQRGSLLSGDEELMSFDRLLDPGYIDTSKKNAVTVSAMGDGRYRAKYVSPVFELGSDS